jgi:ferredoxin
VRTIVIDPDRCEGHGKCYRLAPALFAPADDHGHSEVVGNLGDDADTQDVRLAERAVIECPESAIAWVDQPASQSLPTSHDS